MSQKCSPIQLPIQIEATCKSGGCRNECGDGSKLIDINATNVLTFNDQGDYLDKCSKSDNCFLPYVNMSYLSNVRQEILPDNEMNLATKYLKWCDFYTLFFNKNGAFDISQTNRSDCAISFKNQTFETTYKKVIPFNLADQIKKTWSTKNERPISNISIKKNIELNKNTFFIQSVNSAVNYVGLTLDQSISSLLSSGKIEAGNHKTSATIRFIISYLYYFEPLDTSVLVNFNYVTKVPCFKNVYDCDSFCPGPYSKDEICRTNIDFDDEKTMDTIFSEEDFKSKCVRKNVSNLNSNDSSVVKSEVESDIKNEVDSDIKNEVDSDIKNEVESDIESLVKSAVKSVVKCDNETSSACSESSTIIDSISFTEHVESNSNCTKDSENSW